MEEVKVLGYQDKPPYERLRSILQAGLRSLQSRDDGRLDFTAASGSSTSRVQVGSHVGSDPWSLDTSPSSLIPRPWSLVLIFQMISDRYQY